MRLALLVLCLPACTVLSGFFRSECGNTLIESREECDDGNLISGDGCDGLCLLEVCGDGLINNNPEEGPPNEDCEGGDLADLDCVSFNLNNGVLSCDASCQFDTSGCIASDCGNDVVEIGEECDDGNQVNGDACDEECQIEPTCGDGFVEPPEQCDDNNSIAGDGCSDVCSLENCGNGTVEFEEECDDGQHCEVFPDACTADDECLSAGLGLCIPQSNDGCDTNCKRTAVVDLALGLEHTCALLQSGDVRCWGEGDQGKLGYGDTVDLGNNPGELPTDNVNVGGVVTQITAGLHHTCALLNTGNVRCWGLNTSGQLGYGDTIQRGDDTDEMPPQDVAVGGAVIQIDAGAEHTCALLETGSIRCWGRGAAGRLGYGNALNVGDNELPVSAGDVNLGGPAIQVSAGGFHTCALMTTGAIRCWGEGSDGRLGYGNGIDLGDGANELPTPNVNFGGVAIQVIASRDGTCALLDSGAVRCWGLAGSSGRLGYGNQLDIGDNELPFSAGDVNLGGPVKQLASSGAHTCAVLDSGALRCWGFGNAGRLGYGNALDIGDNAGEMPPLDVNVGGEVRKVETGYHASTTSSSGSTFFGGHTCAIVNNGTVRCWGRNTAGALGYGNNTILGDNAGEMPPQDVPVF